MIDAEFLVGKYLAAQLDARVVGRTPEDTSGAWIKLTQLDARAVDSHRSDHLVDYLLQFEVYAGSQRDVHSLANATRAALAVLPGPRTATRSDDTEEAAVVTGVIFSGMPRLPDTDFKPARERVILTASVFAHPAS